MKYIIEDRLIDDLKGIYMNLSNMVNHEDIEEEEYHYTLPEIMDNLQCNMVMIDHVITECEDNRIIPAPLLAPDNCKSWQDYAWRVIPSKVEEFIDKHGSTAGLNCRRLVGKAIKDGIIPLPSGYTIEQLSQ